MSPVPKTIQGVAALAGASPSGPLDLATPFDSGWVLSFCPEAMEGTVYFQGARTRTRVQHAHTNEEKNRRDADARRRRTMRQFAVANHLAYMVTLTFAEAPADEEAVYRAVGGFLDDLRASAFGGSRFPWLYVVERGARRGRLHAHALVPKTFPGHFGRCWPHGTVDIKPTPTIEDRRREAMYLAKFVTGPDHNRQGYRVAKGFKPKADRTAPLDRERDALAIATDLMGRQPDANIPIEGFGTTVHHLRWTEDDEIERHR